MSDFTAAYLKYKKDTANRALFSMFEPITKQYLIENAVEEKATSINTNNKYEYGYPMYYKSGYTSILINGKVPTYKHLPTCDEIQQFAYTLKAKNNWDCYIVAKCDIIKQCYDVNFVEFRW